MPTTLLGPLKWVGLGLASAAVPVLHDPRASSKREGETLGHAGLADRDRGARVAGRSSRPRTQADCLDTAASIMLPPRVPDASLQQLDQLMEREPERVAAQVKAWMAED